MKTTYHNHIQRCVMLNVMKDCEIDMKRTCQLIKNIIDDNFDCTKSTSGSELSCDSNVFH